MLSGRLIDSLISILSSEIIVLIILFLELKVLKGKQVQKNFYGKLINHILQNYHLIRIKQFMEEKLMFL